MKSLQNDGVKATKNQKVAFRQFNAWRRLNDQKKSGHKMSKGKIHERIRIPLTLKDYRRIEKEMNSLESKLRPNFSHLFHAYDVIEDKIVLTNS